MSKLQICPDCKKETILSREGKVSTCHNPKCNLGGMIFGLGFWNRIRIAPDDNLLNPLFDHERDCVTIKYEDWMQPQYPKEQLEKIIKEAENG